MRKAGDNQARARGFTLIEVVVTIGLLVLVMGLLLVPVFSSLGYFRSATARADAQNAARIALDTMARELTEAMYVHLDMYDNSMIAFVPPLRVDPDDATSEIVTPPRPDWSQAIRYWPALTDPTTNYSPSGRLGPANTFFLARTVVPDPLTYDDPWNRWSEAWALAQDEQGSDGTTRWAAISRVVHSDVDWRFEPGRIGQRSATLQPGYPYLDVQYRLANDELTQTEASRRYRDAVVALTPNANDYDVSHLEFSPYVVAGEWLRPAAGAGREGFGTYQARYPLWRLGAPYTGWAQLSDDVYVHELLQQLPWARDPFLLIHRFDVNVGQYVLYAVGVFDPRTRTMKVVQTDTRTMIYDTGQYPYRPASATVAFEVDWVDGSLRSFFPPEHEGDEAAMQSWQPFLFQGGELTVGTAPPSYTVYDRALRSDWANRAGGDVLASFVAPDSVVVRVDTNGDSQPDRTLTRVFCTPRAGWDEFQLGDDPTTLNGDTSASAPAYGYLRLPERLAGEGADPRGYTFYVDFHWRNNGVVLPGGTLADEKPDLISAYYRTASVVDMTITVTRANPAATAGQRVAQSAHMTRRVKLRNLLREIRYEE